MKPARVFVIGDTHFGHVNILKFEPVSRPFKDIQEHDEELVRRWNSVVEPQDTVWHLGDAVFGRQNAWRLELLNGHKRLVMGNHDRLDTQVYLKSFERMFGVAVIDRKINGRRIYCVLTHIPVAEQQFYRFDVNIHGHLHEKSLPDPRYINVSCEQTGLAPVLLDEVLERYAPANSGL